MKVEGEVEPTKEQHPAGLTRVQPQCSLDVSQVLVIGPNYERLLSPLQPVPLLFQGQFDR